MSSQLQLSTKSTSFPIAVSRMLSPHLPDVVTLDLIDEFVKKSALHPKLQPFFERIDSRILRQKLASFLCHILGGLACDWKRMERAHKHVPIKEEHFDALLAVLSEVLDDVNKLGNRKVPWKFKIRTLHEAEKCRPRIMASSSLSKCNRLSIFPMDDVSTLSGGGGGGDDVSLSMRRQVQFTIDMPPTPHLPHSSSTFRHERVTVQNQFSRESLLDRSFKPPETVYFEHNLGLPTVEVGGDDDDDDEEEDRVNEDYLTYGARVQKSINKKKTASFSTSTPSNTTSASTNTALSRSLPDPTPWYNVRTPGRIRRFSQCSQS